MEQNLPLAAKKVWGLVRVMLYMLKKNMCKRKLILDLNMMMKRGKLAGKALQNRMFQHHHAWSSSAHNNRRSQNFTFPPPKMDDYEFSCSKSPAYPISLFTTNKKHHYKNKTSTIKESHDEIFVNADVIKMLEILTSATASPALPGFGKSPMVRQLRITDSPFPLCHGDEDSYVDEAAEKFIMKFYKDLRKQN